MNELLKLSFAKNRYIDQVYGSYQDWVARGKPPVPNTIPALVAGIKSHGGTGYIGPKDFGSTRRMSPEYAAYLQRTAQQQGAGRVIAPPGYSQRAAAASATPAATGTTGASGTPPGNSAVTTGAGGFEAAKTSSKTMYDQAPPGLQPFVALSGQLSKSSANPAGDIAATQTRMNTQQASQQSGYSGNRRYYPFSRGQ